MNTTITGLSLVDDLAPIGHSCVGVFISDRWQPAAALLTFAQNNAGAGHSSLFITRPDMVRSVINRATVHYANMDAVLPNELLHIVGREGTIAQMVDRWALLKMSAHGTVYIDIMENTFLPGAGAPGVMMEELRALAQRWKLTIWLNWPCNIDGEHADLITLDGAIYGVAVAQKAEVVLGLGRSLTDPDKLAQCDTYRPLSVLNHTQRSPIMLPVYVDGDFRLWDSVKDKRIATNLNKVAKLLQEG
jgi:hypothetical protein